MHIQPWARSLVLGGVLGTCLGAPVEAGAQVDTPAQELLRQQERERSLRERQEARPDARLQVGAEAPADRLPAAESPCFPIARITLHGELADRFQWALAAADAPGDPATGRCLGTRGVDLVLRRVQNAVIARGFITTRILAAPQDLSGGTLALTVVPGRVRALRPAPEASPGVRVGNALPVRPGALLNLRDIEQGLENLQRLPTVSADIAIVPAEGEGAGPGESDLAIQWQQRRRWRGQLSLDDAGSQATGKLQGGATLSIDHALRANDLFYANVGRALFAGDGKGTRSWTAHYDVPQGYWLFGATASSYDYRQTVVGPFQRFTFSGSSDNAELRVSRLLFRNATARTGAYARGWWRQSDNFIDDTEIEVQRRRTAGWELGANHRQFLGTATLEVEAAYRRGTGAFGALRAPEEIAHALDPAIPLDATSRLRVVTASAQFSAPFRLGRQALRYHASARAQWNRSPLPPQERFAIGGRYTVRGFDGEVSLTGERGWLLRNELELALGGGQAFYVAADYGRVGGPATRLQLGDHLAGTALGLRGGWRGLSWDAWVGAPLSRPRGFPTASTAYGFSLAANF